MGALNPAVALVKFDREVRQLRDGAEHFRQKGVFLLQAAYPMAVVLFAAPQLTPPGLVMAVQFDYTDFDLKPPSIRFVDPFTGVPYTKAQLPTEMPRAVDLQVPEGFPLPVQVQQVAYQPLIQAHEDGVPFLCVPGVREFHEHPGHTGQPWELERTTGAGSLVRLVEMIHKYAIGPIGGWSVNLVPQVSFGISEPPR